MEDIKDVQTSENYELMIIFLSDLGEENINKELSEFKKLITEGGGKIVNEDTWGNRELSYRIKKQDKGFYLVLNFITVADKIAEMQKTLTLHTGVIRYLLTKTPINYKFKTLEEYEAEALVAKAELEKTLAEEKAKKEARVSGGRPIVKQATPKISKKETKVEKPEEKKTEEETPAKKPRKVAEKSSLELDDLDKKLKSIIDDPDITL
ncbi:MAG: 30S ribosomal protein S6 [Patescibacteria group bacterium]